MKQTWIFYFLSIFFLCLLSGFWFLAPWQSPIVETSLGFMPQSQIHLTPKGVELRLIAPKNKFFPINTVITAWLETPAGILVQEIRSQARSQQTIFFSYRRAGLCLYQVKLANQTLHGEFRRMPQKAVHPLQLNVGARAVRLDTKRLPALVMHPVDALGNVADTPIIVRTRSPDGKVQKQSIQAQHLLAWTWLPVGRQTGLLHISSQTSDAFAERSEVDLLAGATQVARLQTSTKIINTSSRDELGIVFLEAQDRFGNPAIEGAAVEFSSSAALGWHLFMTRPLVRSTASVFIPIDLPASQITMKAQSEQFEIVSQNLEIQRPNPKQWRIWFVQQKLYSSVIQDNLGAMLDDGTPVSIQIWTTQQTLSSQTTLKNGQLQWRMPTINGVLKKVRVEIANTTQVLRIR